MKLYYAGMCIRISGVLIAVSQRLVRFATWLGGRAARWTCRARTIVEREKAERGAGNG